jgi:phenylalanyl-tRNA synthetase alpha chain
MSLHTSPAPVGTISEAALERARSLRDLSDPGQGPHAMQLLLADVRTALTDAWHTDVLVDRADPVVSIADCYDRLGYPPDAVTREARYSRYVSADSMLRTHMTALVPPLLRLVGADPDPPGDLLLVCPGLAYRRDAIDRLHVGEPHQCDLWRVRRGRVLVSDDLREMIVRVIDAALPGSAWRAQPRAHPYTLEGVQVDVRVDDEWIEVLECGLAHPKLLEDSGLPPKRWSGLAMGMGLDRLLMLRKGIDDIRLLRAADPRIAGQMQDLAPYRPVSNQPPITRDLSVAVASDTTVEEIGDRVRAAIPDEIDSVESVRILSETAGSALPQSARARMGLADGQKNVLLRVVLRHPGKTLTAVEANVLRDRVYGAVHEGGVGEWAGTGIGTV